MDQNTIFKHLHELEMSLSSISSAVEMVEKSTQAYDALRMQAERYCEELPAITSQLKILAKQMDAGWEGVLSEMDNRGKSILDDITSSSERFLVQTEKNNSSFREATDATARSFRTQLLDEQRVFKENIHQLELVCGEIIKINKSLLSDISKLNESLITEIKNINNEIKVDINAISENIQQHNKILLNIKSQSKTSNIWAFILFTTLIGSNAFIYYLLKMVNI